MPGFRRPSHICTIKQLLLLISYPCTLLYPRCFLHIYMSYSWLCTYVHSCFWIYYTINLRSTVHVYVIYIALSWLWTKLMFCLHRVVINRTTIIMLTCEPVDIINQCTVMWKVSNTLVYTHMIFFYSYSLEVQW